ncbi:MAG: hypothetical protein ACRDYD_05705, partial [Acidimicrobiales bacterium]
VGLLTVTMGDDGALAAAAAGLGYDGLVVEALGGGHLPPATIDHLADLARSVPVVVASRTGAGELLRGTYGFAGSETDLHERGLLRSGFLDGRKARLLLTVLLRGGATRREIAAVFEDPFGVPEAGAPLGGPGVAGDDSAPPGAGGTFTVPRAE